MVSSIGVVIVEIERPPQDIVSALATQIVEETSSIITRPGARCVDPNLNIGVRVDYAAAYSTFDPIVAFEEGIATNVGDFGESSARGSARGAGDPTERSSKATRVTRIELESFIVEFENGTLPK